MLGAKISSSRTMGKSVTRLEQMGFFERNNEGRVADKPGAFVFRSVVSAGVKQYGEKATPAETTNQGARDESPRTLHPRPPADVVFAGIQAQARDRLRHPKGARIEAAEGPAFCGPPRKEARGCH